MNLPHRQQTPGPRRATHPHRVLESLTSISSLKENFKAGDDLILNAEALGAYRAEYTEGIFQEMFLVGNA